MEHENRRLKQLYADLSLENRALKGVIAKALKPQQKREVIQTLRQERQLSERRACQVVRLSRSVYRHQPATKPDQPIVEALLELAPQKPELGEQGGSV